jgi:putative salt-induced outer membrane protein YdiY
MKYFILVSLFALIGESCFAATATAPTSSTNLLKAVKATATPPVTWCSTVTMGLTVTEGNVDSVLTTGKISSERKSRRNDLTLGADGAYGQVSGIQNANSAHGAAQDNQVIVDDKWYGYGREDALHDAIADVEYRVTTSLGAGYYFIKKKNTTLSSEAGPSFRAEKLDDETHNYPTARIAENLEHKIDDHAKVWENVEFLPPLNFPDAFLVNAEVGVETPLTKTLSLQTYLQDNYANVPAPGFKPNDLKLVSGLVMKF